MENFSYIARDAMNQTVEGQRIAKTRQDVLTWLRENGLTPIVIDRLSRGSDIKTRKIRIMGRPVKSADLAEFCWQLSAMIEGGVPLIDALDTIAEDIENIQLKDTLYRVIEDMKKGEPFSECILEHPRLFDKLFCSMVLAGESGGALTTTLQRLADHFVNKDKLARKLKAALSYPIFVISFIIFIVIAVMMFIVPRFRVIFEQIGGELPLFTQMFIGFYDVFKNNLFYIVVGSGALITISIVWSKTKSGHRQISKILLSIPIVGRLLKQSFIVVFCRTLSTLLANGVSVLDALTILSGMTKNDVIHSAIVKTRDRIVEGSNISTSMLETGFFPNMATKMVQVGEESGSMPKVLDRTSDYFERKVEGTMTTLTAILEPALIVMVGAIVLVVVVALYLPIFSISDIRN